MYKFQTTVNITHIKSISFVDSFDMVVIDKLSAHEKSPIQNTQR